MTRALSPATARPHPGSPSVRFAARERATAGGSSDRGRPLTPTVARWALELDNGFEAGAIADPATALVRRSLTDYRAGRADQASRVWHEDICWAVPGGPPVGGVRTGPEAVFAYHALLERLTEGT